jgi:AcrR family transcriptional regulator
MDELPILQEEPFERADAARNRSKVLAAAERLFAERCPSDVSMDEVAAAAGVGKGTLFRRFGDRVGLMQALLTERERELQDRVLRGPPPLGPGAPPVERLVAFGCALVRHNAEHGELLMAAEADGARYRSAPYAVYRAHVSVLVREALPDADWEYLADVLLAALGARHLDYLRRVRGMPDERIRAGWEELMRRLLT